MFKNRIAVALVAAILTITIFSQTCFAFPSILDDVPEKQILTTETKLGKFSDNDVKRAFKLLKYIGIIAEDEEKFNEDEVVSRAYAVSAFASMLSGERLSGEAKSFSDVPATHEYAAGIAQAVQYGFLDATDSKFYPNKNASYEDVAKWALRVLNYDVIMGNNKATFVARNLGVFDGINQEGDYVTLGKFMRILENVLNAEFAELNISGSGVNYTKNETKTFLNERYNISIQEGILTGYKYSSLYGDIDLEPGKVQINRAEFDIAEELSVDYVGNNVCAYVTGEKNNQIITLWLDEGRNKTYEVKKEDYTSFELSQITYNKTKRIKLDNNIRVMRNNLFDGYYGRNILNLLSQTDKIVVIDNNGDGKGDLIKVYKYTYYLAKSVSVVSENIIFANDGGALDMGNGNTTEFIFEGKVVDPYKDIKANDVLTALEGYRNNGERIFVAEISRDIVEGSILESSSDDIGPYYIIDNEYKQHLSDELKAYMTNHGIDSYLGAYVLAYIGNDGKIVSIKKESAFKYGYIMNAIGDSFQGTAAIRIYNDEGIVKELDFAEKVIVYNSSNLNGKKVDAYNAYSELYTDGVIKNEMIAYSLNADGLVNRIAFAIDRTLYKPETITYPLTLDLNYTPTGESDANARVYRGVLASKYVMNGNTPVFVVPSPETSNVEDEKLYQKKTSSWSENYFNPSEVIKAYNMSKFYQPQFYVINGEVATNISQGEGKVHFYVIDDVSTVYNQEEDTIEKAISYYDNKTYKTVSISKDVIISKQGYYCDVSNVDQLKNGDIIQVHINSVGQIDVLTVYFRISERNTKAYGMYYYDDEISTEGTTYTIDATSSMPSIGVVFGKAKASEGNRVIVGTVGDTESPVSVGGSVYGDPYYVVYDTETEKCTPATFADILPDDVVVMRKYYNHVQDVIIIR